MATYATHTKDYIAEALVGLLPACSLQEISISQLAERAQVNRASFYRHFKSKEDVLYHYFMSRFQRWTSTHEVMREVEGNPYLQARGFYEFMLSEKAFVNMLHKADALQTVLLRYLQDAIGPIDGDDSEDVYYRLYHLYANLGVYLGWVQRGMRETPDTMARLSVYVSHESHGGLMRE